MPVADNRVVVCQVVHFGVLINDEYCLLGHSCSQICNRIILPVSKPSNKWVHICWEQLSHHSHHIGLDVACFLKDLFLESWEELLRFSQQNSVEVCMMTDVIFREFVERKRTHGQPQDPIPSSFDLVDQLIVAVVQVVSVFDVVEEPSQVIFCHSTVEIAHQELVILAVQVNLSAERFVVIQLEFDTVSSIAQMQTLQYLLARQQGIGIPKLIKRKRNSVDENVIDVD